MFIVPGFKGSVHSKHFTVVAVQTADDAFSCPGLKYLSLRFLRGECHSSSQKPCPGYSGEPTVLSDNVLLKLLPDEDMSVDYPEFYTHAFWEQMLLLNCLNVFGFVLLTSTVLE